MSAAVRHRMTIEEFLAWEEGQALRWEFDGFEPVVMVFQALSDSTASIDHFVKNQEYRDTPSIRRYVMLEQEFVDATVCARDGDDWVGHVIGADAVLAMPEIGIEVPLTELYEGVSFDAKET